MTEEQEQQLAELEEAKDERIAELEQENKRLRDAVSKFVLAYKEAKINVSSCSRSGLAVDLLLALDAALSGRE